MSKLQALLASLTLAEQQEAILTAQEYERTTPGEFPEQVRTLALRLARTEIALRKATGGGAGNMSYMHTREQIIAAAHNQDPEMGENAMIAVGEWGYWVGAYTYVSKDDVDGVANARTDAQKMELAGLPSVPSNALLAVSESAQRLLDAWDAKTPLAWQPENNRALLEDLREALHTANAAGQTPAAQEKRHE